MWLYNAGYGNVKFPRYACGCDTGEGNGAGEKGCFPVLDQPLRSLEELPFGQGCGSGACAWSTPRLPAPFLPWLQMPAKPRQGPQWILCPLLKGTIVFPVLITLYYTTIAGSFPLFPLCFVNPLLLAFNSMKIRFLFCVSCWSFTKSLVYLEDQSFVLKGTVKFYYRKTWGHAKQRCSWRCE